MKHDGDSRLRRFLDAPKHLDQPGTVSPPSKAEGVVFDDQPAKGWAFCKQGRELLDRLRLAGVKEGFHLNVLALGTLGANRSPHARIHSALGQSPGEPIRVVADAIKVRREGCAEKADSQGR